MEQGYHDIVSVFLLTFLPDLRPDNELSTLTEMQNCVEKLSLQRLRDSMGVGLGPLIGQLR